MSKFAIDGIPVDDFEAQIWTAAFVAELRDMQYHKPVGTNAPAEEVPQKIPLLGCNPRNLLPSDVQSAKGVIAAAANAVRWYRAMTTR